MIRASLKENRRTLALAIPIVSGHVGQMLMGWVDTILVGRLGVVELGAAGFANTLLSVPLVFGFGLLSAVSVRASHSHGAGRTQEAGESVRGGFIVAVFLSVVVVGILYAMLAVLPVFGQPSAVNATVRGYFVLCGWSMVPVFFTSVAKNFCEALGRPWAPLWIMFGGVLFNALFSWVAIFGKWGFPAMGIDGAGLGTLVARILVMLAVVAYPMVSETLRQAWPRKWLAAGLREAAQRILSLGLPVGGMHLCEIGGFALGSLMMGWIGVIPLAAHQIAITCAATAFMVPLGISQAVSVRVGHERGAGRTARLRAIVYGGLGLAFLVMSVTAGVFIGFGGVIAGWFSNDPELVLLTTRLLTIAGLFQIVDGLQVVAAGSLRGFEDTKVPMLIGLGAYWVIALPISWFVAFYLGVGAPGVWVGFVVGLCAAAIALLTRLFSKLYPRLLA